MKKGAFLLLYWLPPVALMALIFYLSSSSSLPDFNEFDFAMKKLAHFSVYALLYLLLFRAFHSLNPVSIRVMGRTGLAAAIIGVLYAISDEIHQSFVPLRNATARDVLIDTAGIAAMCLIITVWPTLFRFVLRRPVTAHQSQ